MGEDGRHCWLRNVAIFFGLFWMVVRFAVHQTQSSGWKLISLKATYGHSFLVGSIHNRNPWFVAHVLFPPNGGQVNLATRSCQAPRCERSVRDFAALLYEGPKIWLAPKNCSVFTSGSLKTSEKLSRSTAICEWCPYGRTRKPLASALGVSDALSRSVEKIWRLFLAEQLELSHQLRGRGLWDEHRMKSWNIWSVSCLDSAQNVASAALWLITKCWASAAGQLMAGRQLSGWRESQQVGWSELPSEELNKQSRERTTAPRRSLDGGYEGAVIWGLVSAYFHPNTDKIIFIRIYSRYPDHLETHTHTHTQISYPVYHIWCGSRILSSQLNGWFVPTWTRLWSSCSVWLAPWMILKAWIGVKPLGFCGMPPDCYAMALLQVTQGRMILGCIM